MNEDFFYMGSDIVVIEPGTRVKLQVQLNYGTNYESQFTFLLGQFQVHERIPVL